MSSSTIDRIRKSRTFSSSSFEEFSFCFPLWSFVSVLSLITLRAKAEVLEEHLVLYLLSPHHGKMKTERVSFPDWSGVIAMVWKWLSRLVPFSQNTLKNTVRQQNTTVKQWKPNRVCRFLLVCVLKVSRNNKTPISLNHVTYIIPLLDIYYQDLPIHWLTGKNYDLNVTLSLATWLTGAQVRKQTDWLNRPSASRLTSQKSVNSQHIETPSPRYHTIETVSVPRTREYRKRPNQFMSNHLIDVQQIKMFTIHRNNW